MWETFYFLLVFWSWWQSLDFNSWIYKHERHIWYNIWLELIYIVIWINLQKSVMATRMQSINSLTHVTCSCRNCLKRLFSFSPVLPSGAFFITSHFHPSGWFISNKNTLVYLFQLKLFLHFFHISKKQIFTLISKSDYV